MPTPGYVRPRAAGQADVLVIFGITGDLAKVMTFRSLYRLEAPSAAHCPIVGVAVDDWTMDHLVEHARESIESTGGGRTGRLRPVHRPGCRYVSRRLRRPGDVPAGGRGDRATAAHPVFYLEIPPFLFGTGGQGPGRGRPDGTGARRGGEAVRPRPGTQRSALADGDAPVRRRVPALPDRPLPGQDGPGRDRSTCGSPTRSSSRCGTATTSQCVQITMAESFGVEDRGHFYDPVGRCATSSSTTSCRSSPRSPWSRRRGRRPADAQGRPGRAVPRGPRAPTRRTTSAASTTGYRDIDGVAPDSTTETYAALRLDIENWRWSGVPFFIRTGKRLPATQTEVRLVFKRPPRLGFCPAANVDPSPTSSWSSSTRRPASGWWSTPSARDAAGPEEIDAGHGVRRRGRRGPDAVRGASRTPRMPGDSTRFTRQDAVEETWRVSLPVGGSFKPRPPGARARAPG